MSITVFSAEYLDDLAAEAMASPRRRRHRNIHRDYSEPCQRLFNAIEPDSYLRPHEHGPHQGPETMMAVRGLLTLIVFDEKGAIVEVQDFGAGRHAEDGRVPVGVETPPGRWHTVVARETGSILLEMKSGPFDPSAPKFLAPWAPEEGSAQGDEYLRSLTEFIDNR